MGVITRTPVGTEVNYIVRFPGGFEAALTIEQFEVLKHFKDRLDDPSGTSDFDLKSLLIFSCITGSRAYGLDTVDSDVDRRGVYLAPANLQWSLYGALEHFEDNSSQSCYWELQKFLVLALKANPTRQRTTRVAGMVAFGAGGTGAGPACVRIHPPTSHRTTSTAGPRPTGAQSGAAPLH